MDQENVVSIHNGILCSHEEEGEMTQTLYAHMNKIKLKKN
jgi:hypothetical protein